MTWLPTPPPEVPGRLPRQPPGQQPPPNEFPRERPPNPGPTQRQGPTPTPAPQAPAPTPPPLAAQQNALTEEQGTSDYLKRMQSRYGMSAEDMQNPENQRWVNKQNAKRRAKAAAPAAPTPSTTETKPTETTTPAPAPQPKLPPDDWWNKRYPGYPGGGYPGPGPGPYPKYPRPYPRLPEWGPPGQLPSPTGPATANVRSPLLTTQTEALKPPPYQW